MPPVHIAPNGCDRVVLVEEMVERAVIITAVGVVEPTDRRGKMKGWAQSIGLGRNRGRGIQQVRHIGVAVNGKRIVKGIERVGVDHVG